jgi:hypothetical protein
MTVKPLTPHRKLFTGLMIAMGIWIAVLLAMYFFTVRG